MSKRPIKFREWAKLYGVRRLSNELGVDRTSVYRYLRGEREPGRLIARHIQIIASKDGAQLKMEDILWGEE